MRIFADPTETTVPEYTAPPLGLSISVHTLSLVFQTLVHLYANVCHYVHNRPRPG